MDKKFIKISFFEFRKLVREKMVFLGIIDEFREAEFLYWDWSTLAIQSYWKTANKMMRASADCITSYMILDYAVHHSIEDFKRYRLTVARGQIC